MLGCCSGSDCCVGGNPVTLRKVQLYIDWQDSDGANRSCNYRVCGQNGGTSDVVGPLECDWKGSEVGLHQSDDGKWNKGGANPPDHDAETAVEARMLQVKVLLEIKTNTRDTERGHEGRYRTRTKNAFGENDVGSLCFLQGKRG